MKYILGCNEIHLQFLVYYNDYRFLLFAVYWPNVHFLFLDGDYNRVMAFFLKHIKVVL